MNTEDKKQGPLQTFKDGVVTVKLWEQRAGEESFVNASIGKLYKDEATGEWHESRSFSTSQLAKLQAMIPEALRSAQVHEYALNNQRLEHGQQQEANLAAERDAVMEAAHDPQQHTQAHAPERKPSPQRSR